MSQIFSKRTGIARVLNKAGIASRKDCEFLVRDGRVLCNGNRILDPEFPTLQTDLILLDGAPVSTAPKVYLALNKPRGLVTSAKDEQGRDTVYKCLSGLNLGHLAPVGRLDKASEGLLLFTNDTIWADSLLSPARGIIKRYHVKWNGIPSPSQIKSMLVGIEDDGETLRARSVQILRENRTGCWLEIALDEGKNREIRRMGSTFGYETIRLVRIAIGNLELGDLPKGSVRHLSREEVENLGAFV